MKRIFGVLSVLALFAFTLPAFAAEITVSAAASLTDAFKEMASAYQAANKGSRVNMNFGASGALFRQIEKGAPVDVFASADQKTMDQAQAANLLAPEQRFDFARNTIVVVVPTQSQLTLSSLQDLNAANIARVSIGNPATVPAGRYAQRALELAGIWQAITPKLINTLNVRQSLDYVARGEVDAGFVFGTDSLAMPDKVRVAFVVPLDESITYPIALTAVHGGKNPESTEFEAKRFIQFVLSPTGQAILEKYGFSKM
jgi:molybdate transport system substrate-binding protein